MTVKPLALPQSHQMPVAGGGGNQLLLEKYPDGRVILSLGKTFDLENTILSRILSHAEIAQLIRWLHGFE